MLELRHRRQPHMLDRFGLVSIPAEYFKHLQKCGIDADPEFDARGKHSDDDLEALGQQNAKAGKSDGKYSGVVLGILG